MDLIFHEKTSPRNTELRMNEIENSIYILRGKQVMMDRDLAHLYQVETKMLKRSVRRNLERFPSDFMFELTKSEVENLRCQTGTSSLEGEQICHGGDRYSPFAFSEPGVAMLSSVLKSDRAIQVNIAIMRAFIDLRHREFLEVNMGRRLDSVERTICKLQAEIGLPLLDRDRASFRQSSLQVSSRVRKIQHSVARYFGIGLADLRGGCRDRKVALARQVAMYSVRKNIGLSLNEIGKIFGGRDHTSVLYACRKIERTSYDAPEVLEALKIVSTILADEGFAQ